MSVIFRECKSRVRCANKRDHPSTGHENIYPILDKLSNDFHSVEDRIRRLEVKCHQWITNERLDLLKRVEKLEDDNRRLHDYYQTSQMDHETCVKFITDRLLQTLLNHQEPRKHDVNQQKIVDGNQWKYKEQPDESTTYRASSRITSNPSENDPDTVPNPSTWLDQRLMIVEEREQKTNQCHPPPPELTISTNSSRALASNLAATNERSNKTLASRTNKLYFALNNEKSSATSTSQYHRAPTVNTIPVDGPNHSRTHLLRRQPQSSTPMTFNKDRTTTTTTKKQETRNYSNHERLPMQTSPLLKATIPKPATFIPRPPRYSPTPIRTSVNMPVPPRPWRPPIPPRVANIRPIITSSPTTTKIVRPSSPSVKTREPVRTAAVLTARPRPGQTIATRAKIVTRHPPATPIPTLAQPSTRVSDLDALITQQQQEDETKRVSSRSNSLSSSTILDQIQRVLFLPETVKHVRPVRSEELKIFSSQIPSDQFNLTNESLATLKTDSLESIPEPEPVADRSESSSKTSNRARDLSEDSLNEHHHIRRILQKNETEKTQSTELSSDKPCPPSIQSNAASSEPPYYNGPVRHEHIQIDTDRRYFLLIDDNASPQASETSVQSSSASYKPPSNFESRKPPAHRLVFPASLGRLIFYRRIYSDSDIYQKNCSKDNEIEHNVYHLDTVRDYSMDYYMLTSYGSDSQLKAWVDTNGDDIVDRVCHWDEDRFQVANEDRQEEEQETPAKKRSTSSSSNVSLLQAEELDWYPEIESYSASTMQHQTPPKNTSSDSNDDHWMKLLGDEQFSASSVTLTTSAEWSSSGVLNELSSSTTPDDSNAMHSNRLSSSASAKLIEHNNAAFQQTANHSWSGAACLSSSMQHERGEDPLETEIPSLVITDEFQSDFYYLCPMTNTTSFSKLDQHKQLVHDV